MKPSVHCLLNLSVVVLLVTLARADEKSTEPVAIVNVWPEQKMPGRAADQPEAFKSPERKDAIRITNVSRPTLSVFPASSDCSGPAPAMIVCPGGGYGYVVMDKEGTEVAEWLSSNGITAVVLKYRTPKNREGALQDIQRAFSVTRAHAAEWKIDSNLLGAIGFSAGGHLAAIASTQFEKRSYPPIDAADKQSCRPDFAVLVYPAYLDDSKGQVSPDLNLNVNIPPTLIVHSEDDKKYVPGSKLYYAALKQKSEPHEFMLYPSGGHGYGLRCEKAARAWPDAALTWFRKIGISEAK